jgi:hypothetical protein
MLVVTTALDPITGGGTPGQAGRGKIQWFDGTSYADAITGEMGATPIHYPIINDQEKTVAVGAYVLCIPGPGGKFHMVTVDKCSRLS